MRSAASCPDSALGRIETDSLARHDAPTKVTHAVSQGRPHYEIVPISGHDLPLIAEVRRQMLGEGVAPSPNEAARAEWLYSKNPAGAAEILGLRDSSGLWVGMVAIVPRRLWIDDARALSGIFVRFLRPPAASDIASGTDVAEIGEAASAGIRARQLRDTKRAVSAHLQAIRRSTDPAPLSLGPAAAVKAIPVAPRRKNCVTCIASARLIRAPF